MSRCAVVLASTVLVTAAAAQAGPTTLDLTCDAAQEIVLSRGAAVLRTGPQTYDRFVRDASFCEKGEAPEQAFARTRDAALCPVGQVCRPIDLDNGR